MRNLLKNINGVKINFIFIQQNNIHPTFVQRLLEEKNLKKKLLLIF